MIKKVVNNSQIHLRNKPSFSKAVDDISMKLDNKKSHVPLSQRSDVPDPYKKVAAGMETQFVNHMIQQMRKSVNKEGPESPASKYYKGLQDYERAKVMSKQGIGLKDVILEQIVPAHLKNKSQLQKQYVRSYQKVKAMEPTLQEANNE